MIGFRDFYGRSEPPDQAFERGVELLIARPDAEYLLASAAGRREPGGVCQLRYRHSLWTASEDCWLEDLFVDESQRRGGLGEALVGAAIERARTRGCGRIELDVSESNRPAWALYERMGFSPGYKPPAPNVLMGLRL
jgi:GNAT superfamily N-acetyltransferase